MVDISSFHRNCWSLLLALVFSKRFRTYVCSFGCGQLQESNIVQEEVHLKAHKTTVDIERPKNQYEISGALRKCLETPN
jgi:hypothetical protein